MPPRREGAVGGGGEVEMGGGGEVEIRGWGEATCMAVKGGRPSQAEVETGGGEGEGVDRVDRVDSSELSKLDSS